MKHKDYMTQTPSSEKFSETIRVRVGADLKTRAEKLAEKMNAKLPPGARSITIADITRMALAQYSGVEKAR